MRAKFIWNLFLENKIFVLFPKFKKAKKCPLQSFLKNTFLQRTFLLESEYRASSCRS